MKRALRVLRFCLLSVAALVAVAGALFGWFLYSPAAEVPQLSGTVAKGAMEVGGLQRTYRTYLPKGLPGGAPLLLVMHGSGQNSADIRAETGYGFERLADQHGFAVVYPDAYTFDWNDCSTIGDFSVQGRPVDDVGFLDALAGKLAAETGADPGRVFATGVSSGGFMSIRLALEAPSRFRAVAAVSANVHVPENFKCKPAGAGTSVMIMNGTKDPLVPFNGGESSLLGLFFKGGTVRSAGQSAQYFADINGIAGEPAAQQIPAVGVAGANVEQRAWRNGGRAEVELVTVQGGGHGMPQSAWRRPRLLGPSPMAPDGPALVWSFFARQRS
ncbi:alpha/beta fold hydrolase [Pseudoduganella sp. LjRoot289]|uniref:alpha/beta hydrolase family esterase n=1 Tax=Pseudoduganella sp. LjRoot289 TaxID=3342314 RepID=UPI003ED11336